MNPRQTGQFVGALEFGGESLWYFDSESAVFVNPCLPGTPRTCLHRAASENDYDVALPDLVQECHTVPLTPPDTLRATESLCLVSHGADAGTAHTIGVFSGAEGDCFRVTRLGDQWSATVVDANFVPVTRDAAADCHRLPHSGQYYLKAYSTATANPAGGIVAIQPI